MKNVESKNAELKDRIKRLPQTVETLKDLFALAVEDEDMELNRWVRREARKIVSADAYEIVRKTYILGARHSFDDYMIACEWNREPQARFWLPRRKVLEGKHKIATKIQEFIENPETLYLGFSLPPGTGKALANDTPVLTRNGWKNHGDLVVGDEVIGMDGEFKKVLHVFPKCMMDRNVEFSNGESIVCHEEHEWPVYDRGMNMLAETKTLEIAFERGRYYVGKDPCGVDRREITKISRVSPVEGNCIEVEGGLYLVGKTMVPTHNSTMIKFLLAYIAGKYPQSASIYVSYSDSMTKMIFDSEKAILTDVSEYAHNEIFPDNGAPDISAEYKTVSYRKKGDFPTIGLVSLGGSVTGRTRANKFLITDDLVKDAEMARSPERLDRLYHDYTDTLTTRMIGDSVKEIQLGTIWSVHDPISRKKREHEGDPRYVFIAIPVCDEDGHSNFMYDHPDRHTDGKIVDLKKNLDPVTFSCLYMQRGIEREGLALPSDELLYYNGVLPDGEPDNILFACDVAWGGGDSLAMPIAYRYGDAVYVADVVFDQRDKTHTRPRVIGKILHHKCKMGRFEANNGGDEYADKVSEELKASGYACNISHKRAPSTQGKLARIEQYVPDIKKFYFLSPEVQSEEYRRFMGEATSLSFTSKNLHDDAADSLAQLAAFISGGVRSAVAFRRPF